MGAGLQFRDWGMVVVLVYHDHIKKKKKKKENYSKKQVGAPLGLSLGGAICFSDI